MLPDGFQWAPRYQYDQGANGLFVAGELVAYLDTRTDGGWLARLDVHLGGELVTRRCTDWRRGRMGCEAWACRHEGRLRREAEAKAAARPCLYWQGKTGAGESLPSADP